MKDENIDEINKVSKLIADNVDIPGVDENIEAILISSIITILVAIAMFCCKWF